MKCRQAPHTDCDCLPSAHLSLVLGVVMVDGREPEVGLKRHFLHGKFPLRHLKRFINLERGENSGDGRPLDSCHKVLYVYWLLFS